MAQEPSTGLSLITRLDGTNYVSWSMKCSLLLRREGLWNVVQNPPDVTSWDPDDDEDAKKIAEFQRNNERALYIIGLTLNDQQLVHIRGEESAARCWDNLKRIYVRDTVGAHINITRKLFRACLQKDGDMLAHLNFMKEVFQQLHEKELIFSELHQVYIILSSLDESYDDFVSSLEVLTRNELTLTDITARLLEESRRRKERHQLREKPPQHKEDSSTAYFVKKCFSCGAKGHIARFCKKGKQQNTSKAKKNASLVMSTLAKSSNPHVNHDLWVVDSGASQCITKNRKIFVKMTTSKQHVSLANGWKMKAAGEGIAFCSFLKEQVEMLYMPKLQYNLLSVRALINIGYVITFRGDECIIEKDGNRIIAKLNNGLYVLPNAQVANSVCGNVRPHDECIHLLHRRMGHINFKMLHQTMKLSDGIRLKNCNKYLNCNICNQQKSKVTPANRINGFKTKEPLEVVFVDIIGPKKPSMGGACYILSILDHYSRYGFCYLMKSKTETFQNFCNWLKFAERKKKAKVITVVTDNGTEFTNSKFQNMLKAAGIQHKRSAPYRPQHNSFVERRGQTLQAMIRTMIADSGLPESLWAEALMCSNHILNNVVNSTTGELPFTLWHGRKPNLDYLHTFGSPAWVHIPSEVRSKGQHRARQLYFVGYNSNHKSYRFWDKGTKKVYSSASAKFMEHIGWNRLESTDEVIIETQVPSKEIERTVAEPIKQEEQMLENVELKEEEVQEQGSPQVSPVIPRRTTRISHPPDRYQATIACSVSKVPATYNEISFYPKEDQIAWNAAIKKELKSLKDLNVYEDVKLPPGKTAIGSKWIFKIKTGIDGTVTHKARLVAQGFNQDASDYDEVFAPSLKASTLRTALVWAVKHGYKVNHLDVETAYLHAPLKHDVYLRKPLGIATNSNNECWKLKKSLYGLKQSGYEWNQCIVKQLDRMGFKAGNADPCLFKKEANGVISLLLLFTDDIALITKTEKEANDIVEELKTQFKIKNLGEIKYYLGLRIDKTRNGYKISQAEKINQLLKTFKMELCKPAKTPMGQEFLKSSDDKSPLFDKNIYQSLIGSLSYLSNWSRPDISFCVNQLARYNNEPTERHWQAAKRILRYLKNTMYYSLYLEPKDELKLKAYADASFAVDVSSRKSTSGICIFLGGVLIGWRSIRQKHLSLSTMEAEFSCLSLLCTDLIVYKQLLLDMGVKVDEPIVVYEDNQSAIEMASNIAVKTRSKHTDLRYLNVRHSIQSRMIVLEYCMSENNVADHFTKAQGNVKHKLFCEEYGLRV